jgi:phage tail-like protein
MPLGARTTSSLAQQQFNLRGDSSKFLVVIDDGEYDLGSWSRVGGLNVTWDVMEYRNGGSNSVWCAPGIPHYSKISLSRATCLDSRIVQSWLAKNAKDPKFYSGSIKLLSWAGFPLCEWTLKAFVPIGWKVADLETKAATVVMETLELAHTGFLHDDIKMVPGAAAQSSTGGAPTGLPA